MSGCINIEENQEFTLDGSISLRAIYTPGHTDDSVSFEVTEKGAEDSAILTGDCVLGCGTAVFEDLYDYMSSLDILKNTIESSIMMSSTSPSHSKPIRHIYPGHGSIIHNKAW